MISFDNPLQSSERANRPTDLRPEAIANKDFNARRIEEIRQAMVVKIAHAEPLPWEWVEELYRRSLPKAIWPGGKL